MALRVFVAGPVDRPNGPGLSKWVAYCYECIEMAGNALNVDTQRPRGEIELDNADPESFQLAIRQRISDSIAVIGMFLPNDSSVPAELSIAAELGKPILIIHQKDAQVPRILSGERVLEDKDEHRMTALIEQFIRQSIPQFRTA